MSHETHKTPTAPQFRYATADDIGPIVELDRRYLPADTIVAAGQFESWRRRNPRTFTCLVGDGGVTGYFSVLPLDAQAMARFVAGAIAERDFTAADILADAPDGTGPGELYFYSIVVDEQSRALLDAVLRQFAAEIERYARRQPLQRIYATAATAAGRRFIERLGFRHRTAGTSRADRHDLYALEGAAIDGLIRRHAPAPGDDDE